MPPSSLSERIAGAPISWGVSEAPRLGHEMPAERVRPRCGTLGCAPLSSADGLSRGRTRAACAIGSTGTAAPGRWVPARGDAQRCC